jgi:hypothetical protein
MGINSAMIPTRRPPPVNAPSGGAQPPVRQRPNPNP